jgi:Stage II sporulation protein E (SpoIIE)
MLPRTVRFFSLIAIVFFALGSVLSLAQETAPRTVWFVPTTVVDDLGKGTVRLSGPWQFHPGDDAGWASPSMDDSLWEQISADKPWGLQGYANYDDYAWYRLHLKLSPAPEGSQSFALLFPAVDDVYEVYWNGKLIGHLGKMPPHWLQYSGVPAQIFNLGAAREGVLAVRVWKAPLFSNDDGKAGGFETAPLVGSAEAIANAKGDLDFQWLRGQQFRFALTSLYALVALLSLVAWLRDRGQWLVFWMIMFASCLVIELFLNGLRLYVSNAVLTCAAQIEIAIREMSLWFLLLWILRLQKNRRLVVLTRKAALVSVFAATLDGIIILLYPAILSKSGVQLADAILTPLVIFFELLPLMMVAYAFAHSEQLDSARWAVGAVAFCNGMVFFVQNVASQGVRFTHWTLAEKIGAPLFNFSDSPITLIVLFRTLLFFSILYAVYRFSIEHQRRTVALQQEYQSARELQRVLVPSSLPVVPGFTLTSAYRPAQEVGGDFFQIIPLEDGSTIVVLGDVSGKGLMAAMAVSLIVGAVRALAEDHSDPADLLTLLNRRLCGRLHGGFATCLILRIDPKSGCRLASAGHPAPYKNEREVDVPGALPLGISPTVTYEATIIDLEVGDYFSLYTDGLLEARNQAGELYSFSRLERLFATHPSAAQATQAAINFGQDDDITVLTLTRLASVEQSLAIQTS